MALSALLPRPRGVVPHECRLCDPKGELANWTTPVDWIEAIDTWIALEGDVYHRALDLMVFSDDHLQDLGAGRFLSWLRTLAEKEASELVGLVAEWLISMKQHVDTSTQADWDAILDLLTAAGDINVGAILD